MEPAARRRNCLCMFVLPKQLYHWHFGTVKRQVFRLSKKGRWKKFLRPYFFYGKDNDLLIELFDASEGIIFLRVKNLKVGHEYPPRQI